MIDTQDIMSAKRLVREVLPLLSPAGAAFGSWLLSQSSWQAAIVHAGVGTCAALWLWAQRPPFSDASKYPPPPKTPADGGATDLPKPPSAVVLVLAILATMYAIGVSPAAAATTTSSVTKAKIQVAPAAIANVIGWRLSGDARGVALGAGAGVRLDFDLAGLPLSAGVYGAPVLALGDGSIFNFAPILSLSAREVIPVPIGLGLGWLAFSVGGTEPGLHRPDLGHIFIAGHLGLPIFGQ